MDIFPKYVLYFFQCATFLLQKCGARAFFVSVESLESGIASGRLGSSRVEPEILPATHLGFLKKSSIPVVGARARARDD